MWLLLSASTRHNLISHVPLCMKHSSSPKFWVYSDFKTSQYLTLDMKGYPSFALQMGETRGLSEGHGALEMWAILCIAAERRGGCRGKVHLIGKASLALSPAQRWRIKTCFKNLPFWLFATPWTAACQDSLLVTISQSLLQLVPMESVMPSNLPFEWLLMGTGFLCRVIQRL